MRGCGESRIIGEMSLLYLFLSAVGLAASLAAWLPWRPSQRLAWAAFPYFLVGWLTGELALQHLALQALVTLWFAWQGALGVAPGVLGLALTFVSWGLLLACHVRALGAAGEVRALAAEHGLDLVAQPQVSVVHGLRHPFRMRRPGVRWLRNIEYGPPLPGDQGRRNLLDVVLPEPAPRRNGAPPSGLRPVLLQIHGGGWVYGDKERQGQPLMSHLASRGWVCFAMNYRLAPRATFPDAIVDVKRAIAWLREHAGDYGADADFVCLTGGSAGGHLASLAALSPNFPAFQPGFEAVDTRVQACAPFYGVYDFLDRAGLRREQPMTPFLAKWVLKCTPQENPQLWEDASPVSHISAQAPPFFVVHGACDSLVLPGEAREFVRRLARESQQPVLHLEMRGAQHAFDTFHSFRSAQAVRAVAAFLEHTHALHRGKARSAESAASAPRPSAAWRSPGAEDAPGAEA